MTDRDRLGRTAMHYAVVDGDAARLRALLAGGADPQAVDACGWTPLHFAAQAQDPVAAVALLAAGALVDAADRQGNTPLWKAMFNFRGEGATIRVLVGAGADPDLVNGHGVSPRVLAGRIANYDVAVHLPGGEGALS
ncbi:ankyrin repeat domain-containing protein [Streptomyces longisporoflavus]|uniref:Ankyrin repeat domain-containing protein n=1 Tax=Streptomyces longisporoflavus TaxID=28044 RepID=A0ABW7R581_9ACTN